MTNDTTDFDLRKLVTDAVREYFVPLVSMWKWLHSFFRSRTHDTEQHTIRGFRKEEVQNPNLADVAVAIDELNYRVASLQKRCATMELHAIIQERRVASRYTGEGRRSLDLTSWPIEHVWDEFRRTRAEVLRSYLLEKYLPLVKYNTERIHAKLPPGFDIDILERAGIFGLIDSISAFEPDHGVRFETFSSPKIRRAIIDELKAQGWVVRLLERRRTTVSDAARRFAAAHGRRPSTAELSHWSGVTLSAYEQFARGEVRPGEPIYREVMATLTDRGIALKSDADLPLGLSDTQKAQLKQALIKELSRSERLVVVLYYYEEMTMKEIGTVLDLSEARVSEMHHRILRRLKERLSQIR